MIHKRRVILVEDEFLARDELKDILRRKHLDIDVVGEAKTPEEAHALIEKGGVDGVFLDINLEMGTKREGMDLAYAINNLPKPPWIVFTTAYEKFAVEAFNVHPAHYLLKPFRDEDVAKALATVPSTLPRTLAVKHHTLDGFGKSQWAEAWVDPAAELLYVCTDPNRKDKLRMHLVGCQDLLGVAESLEKWKIKLAPYGIAQNHKGCLVNRAFIRGLQPHPFMEEKFQILLKGCSEALPVGNTFLNEIKKGCGAR